MASEQKELRKELLAHADGGSKDLQLNAKAVLAVAADLQAAALKVTELQTEIGQLKSLNSIEESVSECRLRLKEMADQDWTHDEFCREALRDIGANARAIHENSETLLDRVPRLHNRAPPIPTSAGGGGSRPSTDGGSGMPPVINLVEALGGARLSHQRGNGTPILTLPNGQQMTVEPNELVAMLYRP
ncbi:unnamed protein product [Symbiodinium natans]|uniref:Uncharacterized protein n=1 Tax=Symbiodinium natans TaxID=878477 RepID=A0A812UKE8_9DINO|nr:unnamed protein product [Symbiodinium natans]